MSTYDEGGVSGFAQNHPLVVVFLCIEVVLLCGGSALGLYAPPAGKGSVTTLAHVAGIMGATGVVFGVLALIAFSGYFAVTRFRFSLR